MKKYLPGKPSEHFENSGSHQYVLKVEVVEEQFNRELHHGEFEAKKQGTSKTHVKCQQAPVASRVRDSSNWRPIVVALPGRATGFAKERVWMS